MNASPVLREIALAMRKAKLTDVILIGNAGAAVRGADVTTIDFDFMWRNTAPNRRKLISVAEDLGADLLEAVYSKSDYLKMERESDHLEVEMLSAISGIRSFESLRSRSSRIKIDDYEVTVASLADIIKSKKAAGRPKDLAVMPMLEAAQREIEEQAKEEAAREPRRASRGDSGRVRSRRS